MAKTSKPAPKPTPTVAAKEWFLEKNDTNRIYFRIHEYQGKLRLDIREFYHRESDADGKKIWQFTSRGTSINLATIDVDKLVKIMGEVLKAVDEI